MPLKKRSKNQSCSCRDFTERVAVLTLIQPVHLSKHDFKAIKVSLNNKPFFFSFFFIWLFSFFRKLVTQCKSVAMSLLFFFFFLNTSQAQAN